MNNAKKLSLDEIIALPKASVIWYELDSVDDEETGIAFYEIWPALISVPGKNGVICYADTDVIDSMDINQELFEKHNRIFWDREPDRDMISGGVQSEYYNTHIFYPKTKSGKKLVTAITSRGHEIIDLCNSCGIDESYFMEIIDGQRKPLTEEIHNMINFLKLSDSEADEIFKRDYFAKDNLFDIKTGKLIE